MGNVADLKLIYYTVNLYLYMSDIFKVILSEIFLGYFSLSTATFILSENYIRQSDLKIIGYKGEGAVYSPGLGPPR
jgi:hypothetical protein